VRYARKAFSLIEAAIVLGIVGLVVGGIWIAADMQRRAYGVADAEKAVLSIATGARNLFPLSNGMYPTGSGSGVAINITTTVIKSGLVPQNLISTSNNSIRILNGTSWSIYLNGVLAGQNNSISLAGWAPDSASASRLVNAVIGAAGKSLLAYADCWDGTSMSTYVYWNGSVWPPASPLICPPPGSGGQVSVGFYFYPNAN